jgi:hypothetical protein
MAPEEHKLSQAVLEFLIAQQDWFMLDVPPPGRRDSILGGTPPIDVINHLDEKARPFSGPVDTSKVPAGADWTLLEDTGKVRRGAIQLFARYLPL